MKFSLKGFCRSTARCLFKLLYHHKVYGKQHVIGGHALIAANHSSYLDPPIIGVSAPCDVHFLAKTSLFSSPFAKWFFAKLDTHAVKGGKENSSTFRLALQLLDEGKKLVIFPEGGRSVNGELMKGEKGVGLLVERARCPIIPTYIHGAYEIWDAKSKRPKLKGRTACVFGSPLYFDELLAKSGKGGKQLVADCVMQAILDLKNWYLAGAKGPIP